MCPQDVEQSRRNQHHGQLCKAEPLINHYVSYCYVVPSYAARTTLINTGCFSLLCGGRLLLEEGRARIHFQVEGAL